MAVGNQDSALKGHEQKTQSPQSQHRDSSLKMLGSDPPADLGDPPGEAGGSWDSLWGLRH